MTKEARDIIASLRAAAEGARAEADRKKAHLESGYGKQTRTDMIAASNYASGLERALWLAEETVKRGGPIR